MLHIRFILLAICISSFSQVNATTNKRTYADIRENVIKLADGLKQQYDTVLVVVDPKEEYVILTDSILYEDGEFDGFSIFTAHYKSNSTFVLEEVDPEKCSYNFSRDIIAELLKTKPKEETSWENWEIHRPYSAILINGEIVYEHFMPQCSQIGEPQIDNEVVSYMIMIPFLAKSKR